MRTPHPVGPEELDNLQRLADRSVGNGVGKGEVVVVGEILLPLDMAIEEIRQGTNVGKAIAKEAEVLSDSGTTPIAAQEQPAGLAMKERIRFRYLAVREDIYGLAEEERAEMDALMRRQPHAAPTRGEAAPA